MKLSKIILLFSIPIGAFIFGIAWLIFFFFGGLASLYILIGFAVFMLAQWGIVSYLMNNFSQTVQKLKRTNNYKEPVSFAPSRIHELNELHKELNEFSLINREHYLSQKQYTENLSHELLTPLAIIRTKAELLLQAPDLREVDLQHLDSIIQTVGRLSKLNRALILLSKIDNNQFVDLENIPLKDLVSESLENFEDQIRKKQLEIQVDLSESSTLHSNLNLMRILVSNLIKNAVFHNHEKGFIKILLTEKKLVIENSGLPNDRDPALFFKRFISDKASDHSIGLGLSITQQICLLFDYTIQYEAQGTIHQLTVSFR